MGNVSSSNEISRGGKNKESPTRFTENYCRERKLVNFVNTVDVYIYDNSRVNAISNTELWYSRDDVEAMRCQGFAIAKGMKNGEIVEGNEHSLRGLELHDPKNLKRCRRNYSKSFEAVMFEQKNQMKKQIYDPNAIASVYIKKGAKKAQNDAYRRGTLDCVPISPNLDSSCDRKKSQKYSRINVHALKLFTKILP